MNDERFFAVRDALFAYVNSPSLRHLRDPASVTDLAHDIVRRIDGANGIWQKWDGQRQVLLKSALSCWIPPGDLREFLNTMPGPKLTLTDVVQRLRAFEEEEYFSFPREEFKEGCLALYQTEKASGTELSAIIGAIRDYVEECERRRSEEHDHELKRMREDDRARREERLRSGADCGWTPLPPSMNWYCRVNGRTYRFASTKDKKWDLLRVNSLADEEAGELIGRYQGRAAATKALAEIAYKPELRW